MKCCEALKMKTFTLIILTLLLTDKVFGDSWAPPKIKDYYSLDSTYFVRVFPQKIPDKYWKWVEASPRKKKKFQRSDTLVTPCHAKLYKKKINGGSLIN
jgi:hypothetical protein